MRKLSIILSIEILPLALHGLILHVDLVQQAIPAGFQIQKSNNGSSVVSRGL